MSVLGVTTALLGLGRLVLGGDDDGIVPVRPAPAQLGVLGVVQGRQRKLDDARPADGCEFDRFNALQADPNASDEIPIPRILPACPPRVWPISSTDSSTMGR